MPGSVDSLLPLAHVLLGFPANAGIRMARDDVAQHAKRALIRQLVERVERLDLDGTIGIVEDRALDAPVARGRAIAGR